MKIDEVLEEMENLLLDARGIPLTHKRIMEEDDLIRLIDALRDALPEEIHKARHIMGERQRIMDEAHKAAQEIVDQAQAYAMKLTDESAITKQAQDEAADILSRAKKNASGLEQDALQYASDIFSHIEQHLEKTLGVIRQSHNELEQQAQTKQ